MLAAVVRPFTTSLRKMIVPAEAYAACDLRGHAGGIEDDVALV
jgi:hypothetical protein